MKAIQMRFERIEMWQSRKKIGEGRIDTIGWSGNKTDWQLIHWKLKIRWGIKMTRSIELI